MLMTKERFYVEAEQGDQGAFLVIIPGYTDKMWLREGYSSELAERAIYVEDQQGPWADTRYDLFTQQPCNTMYTKVFAAVVTFER